MERPSASSSSGIASDMRVRITFPCCPQPSREDPLAERSLPRLPHALYRERGSRLIQRCWLPGFAASRRKLPRRHPLTASTSRVYERSYPLALAQLVIESDRLLGLVHVREDVPILQLL